MPVCAPALASVLRAPADLAAQTLLTIDAPNHHDAPTLDWEPWLQVMGLNSLRMKSVLRFSHYTRRGERRRGRAGRGHRPMPLLRELMQDGRLVAPFGETAASRRGYFIDTAVRAAGNRDAQDFRALAAGRGGSGPGLEGRHHGAVWQERQWASRLTSLAAPSARTMKKFVVLAVLGLVNTVTAYAQYDMDVYESDRRYCASGRSGLDFNSCMRRLQYDRERHYRRTTAIVPNGASHRRPSPNGSRRPLRPNGNRHRPPRQWQPAPEKPRLSDMQQRALDNCALLATAGAAPLPRHGHVDRPLSAHRAQRPMPGQR